MGSCFCPFNEIKLSKDSQTSCEGCQGQSVHLRVIGVVLIKEFSAKNVVLDQRKMSSDRLVSSLGDGSPSSRELW